MRNFLQFNLGFILSVTFLVAICFAKSVSPWMLLFLFEVVLIWLVLTILYRGVPTSLCNASDANCYRIDRDVMVWQGLGQFRNSELHSQPHFVKSSFPILIGTVILWLVGSCVLVRRAYQISLRRFCDGIRSRGNEYFNVDLGRLQG